MENKNPVLVVSIGILIVVFIGVMFWAFKASAEKFKAECDELGGRVDSETATSQSYGSYTAPNGKMTTGSHTTQTTTTYCLSKTGGILAIK